MRIYQGVDLIEVDRVKDACERHAAFGEDIFTEGETAYCRARPDPYPHLAGRFAVKEACLKAFGLGMGGFGATGKFREIEVESAPSGKPTLRLHGSMERIGKRRRIRQATVSISHTRAHAVATVILLGDDLPPGAAEGGASGEE